MLRERLTRCRQSEGAARLEAEKARDTVRSALSSRGRLASRIVAAADQKVTAAFMEIARDTDVVKWARREDDDGRYWQ